METQQPTVGLAQASRILDKYRDRLHSIPGCNYTGIGKLPSGDHYINVGFDSWQSRNDAIRQNKVPSSLEGVPVRIEDKPGIVKALQANPDTSRYRPARGGCSISFYNDVLSGGTLGAWVRDRTTGKVCVLSCEHVLDVVHRPGAWVIQPALLDNGVPADDRIAVNLRGYRDDYHDCAIAEVISDAQISSYGLAYTGVMAAGVQMSSEGGNVWYGQGGAAYVGERVVKYGYTTGFTEGEIDDLDAEIPMQGGGWLRDVIRVKNVGNPEFQFARQGDSGSLVLQKDSSNARGLVTAVVDKIGEPFTWYTYVQKWDRVARKLQIDLGRYRLQPEELSF